MEQFVNYFAVRNPVWVYGVSGELPVLRTCFHLHQAIFFWMPSDLSSGVIIATIEICGSQQLIQQL
jgi:hypothetical protein